MRYPARHAGCRDMVARDANAVHQRRASTINVPKCLFVHEPIAYGIHPVWMRPKVGFYRCYFGSTGCFNVVTERL
jgi:hypothetical protein